MASYLPENNQELINGCDELCTVDLLEIDGALLMSQLLDESHVEDCDDERLTRVIQSLEDEIKPIIMNDHDFLMEFDWDYNNLDVEGCDFRNEGQVDGHDSSSVSLDYDLDYNWMDMEDLKSGLYLDSSENIRILEGVSEFDGVRDYYDCSSSYSNSYANSLEEHNYGSLWQDTNVLLM